MQSEQGPGGTRVLSPRVEALLEGTKYRAVRVLGKGAQGLVIDAVHEALGKPVVIKVPHGPHATEGRLLDRMLLEAQALARLSSPHLVAVHDTGTLRDGRPFFVMDRLWGRTLKDEVHERGPVPVAEAIRIARQVAAALGVVHRAGLVHRDVKPENVFLCEAAPGEPPLVKLLDFGIAKVVPGSFGAVVDPLPATAQGIAIGTPRFLSPEQACGLPLDGRADLYALGVLLFSIVAGQDPFAHHKDLRAILMAHVTERAPRLSAVASQPVPAELERIVERLLEKRPEQRFATAGEAEEALARVGQGDENATTQPSMRASEAGATVVLGSGTVRMPPSSAPHAVRPGRARPPAPATVEVRRARLMVSSPLVIALIATGFAALTLLVLVGARMAGFLR